MNKITKKDLKEICSDINLIISDKDHRVEYRYIYLHLQNALQKQISYDEFVKVCETIVKIARTKNRILRHLEKDFWGFIENIPTQIIVIQEIAIGEDEELLPNTAYNESGKRILSRLVGLAQDILALKDDNSKGSDLRRSSALRLLGDLTDDYHVPCAKNLFVNSINSKNKKEQLEALLGLENYYDLTEEELEADLLKTLNAIKSETNDMNVVSTCLQIQVNAGIMDRMSAVFELDNWKEANYY